MHFHKRQSPTSSGLVFDTSAVNDAQPTDSVPNLTGSGFVSASLTTITTTSDPPQATDTPPAEASTSSATSSSDSKHSPIPIPAVVGACLGAFTLLVILVSMVFWHLRRSKAARARDLSKQRNFERRKSHNTTWNHLPDAYNDGSSDGHGIGMSKGFDFKMHAFPSPPPMTKERDAFRQRDLINNVTLSEKVSEIPQISPLSFETEDHPFKLSPPSPVFNTGTPPPPRPPPLISPPAIPSTHPYALATPMITPMPRTSVASDASVYSSTQHNSMFSDSSHTPMISSQNQPESLYSKAIPSSRITPIPESGPSTGSTSQSQNPFFTAHPSHKSTAEKWGSVGKERSVASTNASSNGIPNNTMENLIAALDLSSANTSLSIPHPLERSIHGHLSMAPSEEEGYDNPFEFDNVYSQDLASPTSSQHVNLFDHGPQTVPHSAYTSKTFLTDTSAGVSGWSSGGISPGAFPMPPR